MEPFNRLQFLYASREYEYLKNHTPSEWECHLLSLGVCRHESQSPRHFVLWSDVLKDWLDFPDGVAERILVLGCIP